MEKKSLFDITREHLLLMDLIEENEGELDDKIELALMLNRDGLKSKALSYVQVIKYCESELQRVKDAELQIAVFKKRKQSVLDKLKASLKDAISLFGPIETGFYSLSLRKSSQVFIEDEKSIPAKYLVEKTVVSPDKMKIKQALLNNMKVPGAMFKINQNLQIK